MPTTLQTNWAGQTDSLGNLTVNLTPNSAWWTQFTVAGKAQGNPIWSLYKNGSFILPGAGPQVGLGPVMFAPAEQLTIQIQGALPNTTISGTLWGQRSTLPDGSDLTMVQPQASGSTPTLSPPIPIFTAVADNALHTQNNIPLPAGTHSIVMVLTSGSFNVSTFTITGHQTGEKYVTAARPLFSNNDTQEFLVSPYDTAVDISFQSSPSGGTPTPGGIYVSASLDPTVVGLATGATLNAVPVDRSGIDFTSYHTSGVQTWNAGTAYSSFNPLLVTRWATQSAPWEAPNQIPIDFSVQLAAGTNVQLIAAPGAGVALWLHDVEYFYTATSASFGKFRRASGSGTPIASWNSNSSGVFRWGRGAPLGANEALFLSNDSGVNMAGFFNGTIQYSIA